MNSLATVVLVLGLALAVTGLVILIACGLARLYERWMRPAPRHRNFVITGYGGLVEDVDLATQAKIHKTLDEEKQRRRRWERVA